MVKLHLDLLTDWNNTATQEIVDMSKTHNFLILEDSKLDDVPNIVESQVYGGLHSFGNWVDAVTVNTVNFVSTNNALYRSSKKNRVDAVSKDLTCIPVGQYNTKDSMVTKDYSVNFRNRLLEEKDARFQTRTIIQQNLYKTDNQFLRMTPGVIEVDEDIIFNEDRDRYRSIETAMMRDRNHVVIIGGNIIINEDVVEKCKSCAARTWENMNLYYKKILDLVE